MAADTPTPATGPNPQQLAQVSKQAETTADSIGKMAKKLHMTSEELKALLKIAKVTFGGLNRGLSETSDSIEKADKTLAEFGNELEEISGKSDDLVKHAKDLGRIKWVDAKSIVQANTEVASLRKQLIDLHKAQKSGLLDEKQLKTCIQQMDDINAKIERQNYLMERSPTSQAIEDMGDGLGHVNSMWGAFSAKSIKGLRGSAKEGGKAAQMMIDKGQGLAEIGTMGPKIAGTLMKAIGGAMGSLSKLMAGPFGIAAIVTKAIWDVGMAADNFVKNANKRFATMRGPDINTQDVKKQFKDFNDELYSTAKNLQVGLNAEQVGEFMHALYQSGVHISKLSTGFKNYRDAVYVAAKASKTLGLEMPDVGMKMGKLMNELRMNIDDIDKLFVNVAFDAKKAGLSTEEFWSAIENATVSLGFYGNFIQNASKQMTKFTKTQVMGVKDSAGMVEELNQSFVKMDNTQRAAFMGLIQHTTGGTKALKNMFQVKGAEFKKKAEQLGVEIQMKQDKTKTDKSPELLDEIKRLQEEQAANQEKGNRIQQALASGNAVDMAPYLQMLSDNSHELLGILIKGRVGDWTKLTGRNVWLAEEIAKATGMSADLIMKSASVAKEMDLKMDNDLEGLGKQMGTQTDAQVKGMDDAFATYTKNLATADDQEAVNKVNKKLSEELVKNGGITQDEADNLAEMLAVDKDASKKFADEIRKQTKAGKKMDEKAIRATVTNLKSIKSGATLASKKMEKNDNILGDTQQQMADSAQATFEKVRDQTLSFEDMQNIAKDEIKWRASSMGIAQKLNEGVFSILKILAKHFEGDTTYMTDQQKASQEALKLNNKGLALDEKGNITIAAQQKLMKDSLDFTKASSTRMNVLGTSGNVLKSMQQEQASGGTGQKALENALTALQDQINTNTEQLKNPTDDKSKRDLEQTKKELNLKMGELKKIKDKTKGATTAADYKKGTEELINENEKQKAISEDIYKKNKATVDQLVSLNDGNKQIIENTRDQLMATPEGQKYLAKKLVAATMDAGGKQEDLVEAAGKMGLSSADLKTLSESKDKDITDAFDTLAKSSGFSDKGSSSKHFQAQYIDPSVKAMQKNENTAASTAAGVKAQANLRSPMMVTTPGIVKMDAGESLMPKGYNKIGLQTVKDVPGAGGGGAKNITISVNATERDLAQRIANEVRGVLYKEQLTGAG